MAGTPMLILFGFVTVACLIMLFGALVNALTAPRLENAPAPSRDVKVSLLIPARDEENNLRVLVPLLEKIRYANLEILILDDGSRDAGPDIIRKAERSGLAANGGSIRLLEGKPLAPGWLGKNWACAQLAEAASGEILLFCDADVRVGPDAVAATVGMLQSGKWDALTGMPRQELGTWAEQAVLPVLLFMPILGWLPIAWVPKIPLPALSVGCGQWFAFTRAMYQRIGGHASVRREIVEDMALGRLVKEKRGILGVALTGRHLSVRMYTDFRSVWAGFSKNLAYLTGSGWLRPVFVLGLFLALNVSPWLMAVTGHFSWLLPLGLWMAVRLIAAALFREPPAAWLWSWAGTLLIPIMCVRSWWGYRRKSVEWKGRRLEAAFATQGYGNQGAQENQENQENQESRWRR